MNATGDIRELTPREQLGHDEIEIPAHHAEQLAVMGPAARREYFRSVRAGLASQDALACAAGVERCKQWRKR